MGFLMPKVPEPKMPAAIRQPTDTNVNPSTQSGGGYSSLMSTGPRGLKRKGSTVKSSLIGGTIE